MKSRACMVVLAMLGVLSLGCGKSDEGSSAEPQTSAAGGSDETGSRPPIQVDASTPKAAVATFFTALRDSDEQTVAKLLTQKAREESERNNVAIDPPQDPSATFTVGDVELVGTDGAYVSGTWTETTVRGDETINIVWILRKEAAEWRIAGLHARSFDETVFLNFEDPEEMHQRRQEAEQGIPPGHLPSEPVRQAQQPTTTGDQGTYR